MKRKIDILERKHGRYEWLARFRNRSWMISRDMDKWLLANVGINMRDWDAVYASGDYAMIRFVRREDAEAFAAHWGG